MLFKTLIAVALIGAACAQSQTTPASTTCSDFTGSDPNCKDGCKPDGDKCVDDVGGGDDGNGNDLFTTTAGADVGIGDGTGCADNDKKASCNAASGCKWEDIEQVCASDQGGNSCEAGTDKAKCDKISGCNWSIAMMCEAGSGDPNTSDPGGGGEDDNGQCTEADIVANKCEKLNTESACTSDETCKWDTNSCGKDEEYDPNDCAALATQADCKTKESAGGELNVVAPGCRWDDTENVCGRNQNTDSSESVCSNFDDKAECHTPTDDGGNKQCEWKVIDEDAAGGDTDCFSVTDETECNGLKTEENKQACSWEEEDTSQNQGGDVGGGGAGEPAISGQCSTYDFCVESNTKAKCDAEQSCQWQDDECKGFGAGGGDGDILQGCSSLEVQKECQDYEGAAFGPSPGGGGDGMAPTSDDGGSDNPVCLWVERKDVGCQLYDECDDKHGTDAAACDKNDKCTWSGSDCRTAVPSNAQCIAAKDSTACGKLGADKCTWVDTVEQLCIDWKECAHFSKDQCEGADEECWWDGENNGDLTYGDFCYTGKKPTTVTTSTSTTTTVTTLTTTTTFHCTPTASGEDRVICGDRDFCVRSSWFCDREDDCGNGFDEQGCVTTAAPKPKEKECKYDQEWCEDYKVSQECVYTAYKCDGTPDCGDKSDEKGCPAITTKAKRTTTKKTTTTTTTTKTITTTRTETTTTEPPCITQGKCADRFMYADALRTDPLYQTLALCRACANSATVDAVCAATITIGCTIDTTDADAVAEQKMAQEKLLALKSGVLTIKTPTGGSDADFTAAILSALTDNGIRATSIIDVELYTEQNAKFSQVLVYTGLTSGATAEISKMAAVSDLTTESGVAFKLYNSKNVDVSNLDADGEPQAYAAGTSYQGDGFENFDTVDTTGTGGGGTGTVDDVERTNINSALSCETLKSAGLLCEGESDQNGSTGGSKSGGNMGTIIGVVVGGLVVVGAAIFGLLKYRSSQGGGTNYKRPPQPNSAYANPGFTAGSGSQPTNSSNLPSWADPTVPFMTRQEAEAQLKSRGNPDKDYVVRQSANNVQGYAVCSVSEGKYTNFQIKRQGTTLFYGNKPLGQDLSEALRSLQNSVPVAPQNGAHYFLNPAASARKASFNPANRVFTLSDNGSA